MIINTDNFAVNFLPSKKRKEVYKAFAKVLLNPLQILFDTIFGTFKSGNSAADWDVSTAYAVGDQVKYIDKANYQCWVANTGEIPTNTDYWFKIQDKFVGIEPRMKYNAQHLIFEWALNEWFGTTFVNSPGDSDIYIEGNAGAQVAFYVGGNETNSSSSVLENGEAVSFIQAEDLANATIEFNIYIPVAVWTALDADASNRDKIVRQLADLYVYGGINYDINTY